ncbi:hypothetical protein GJ700_10535 [Duganella sp. FT92W]|uniref:5'-nucleotidase, lipoprotein e(P4) family n=1 Tax=Pseudoduganella rivuli TaxID=2666085 RepID=A0A7X2LSC9_9BURK|nr:HAD family acid phosphatase [Pseudoduganella rivuli]MRV72151.1 hypothetical protein [Pseudoduganella rivuli]
MKNFASVLMCTAVISITGCATPRDTHENLNAVLWMQTSAEYQMVATGAYRNARNAVNAAMADTSWTAAVEQQGKSYAALPPAIILDVDETVLDNSPSEALTVKKRTVYDVSDKEWDKWVRMKAATPVPGSLEFLKWAVERYPQLTIFYVTNRSVELEPETKANLMNLGYPLKEGADVIISKGDGVPSASDKSPRRSMVADKHRIIMLVGDDLGDFITGKGTPEERVAAAKAYQQYWGERWVILPNPTYGSWERALYKLGGSDAETLQAKFDKLKTAEK